jgi:flagellin
MALSILNNIPALAAQNQLSITGASLQKTLFRLSTGSRINSGADDAAGLAIADGLHANVTALTQSGRNATDGIGKLQVADGAMAQVTNLLNRAITLATEAATGTVAGNQRTALNAEFTQIKAEIDRIGTDTTFNGDKVFQGAAGTVSDTNSYVGDGAVTVATALTAGDTFSIQDTNTGNTFSFTAVAGDTVGTLIGKIQTAAGDPAGANYVNVSAYVNGSGNLEIRDNNQDHSILVSATSTAIGAISAAQVANGGSVSVFLSDGGTGGSLSTSIGQMSASFLGIGAATLAGTDGNNATAALALINTAIQNVASSRGNIGAGINRLQSASAVITNQVQNLSTAEDGIRAADIAQEVANLTKYNILNQTGISALSQANQMQQSVLSLLK